MLAYDHESARDVANYGEDVYAYVKNIRPMLERLLEELDDVESAFEEVHDGIDAIEEEDEGADPEKLAADVDALCDAIGSFSAYLDPIHNDTNRAVDDADMLLHCAKRLAESAHEEPDEDEE